MADDFLLLWLRIGNEQNCIKFVVYWMGKKVGRWIFYFVRKSISTNRESHYMRREWIRLRSLLECGCNWFRQSRVKILWSEIQASDWFPANKLSYQKNSSITPTLRLLFAWRNNWTDARCNVRWEENWAVKCQVLKYWSIEVLKYWSIEVLKYWSIEVLNSTNCQLKESKGWLKDSIQ